MYGIDNFMHTEQANLAGKRARGIDLWHIKFCYGGKTMINEISHNNAVQGLDMKTKVLREVEHPPRSIGKQSKLTLALRSNSIRKQVTSRLQTFAALCQLIALVVTDNFVSFNDVHKRKKEV